MFNQQPESPAAARKWFCEFFQQNLDHAQNHCSWRSRSRTFGRQRKFGLVNQKAKKGKNEVLNAFSHLDSKRCRGKRTPQLRSGSGEPAKHFVFAIEREPWPTVTHGNALSRGAQVETVKRRHGEKGQGVPEEGKVSPDRQTTERTQGEIEKFQFRGVCPFVHPCQQTRTIQEISSKVVRTIQDISKVSELNYETAGQDDERSFTWTASKQLMTTRFGNPNPGAKSQYSHMRNLERNRKKRRED